MNIKVTNKENRYLFGKENDPYYTEMVEALSLLKPHLNNKQTKCLLNDLQFSGEKFDEAKYLQAACETSIASYISSKFNENFSYEPKINPPKDVDCSFSTKGKEFYIEVKCPDFSNKIEIDNKNAFKIGSFGRMSNFEEIFETMQGIFNPENNPAVEDDKPLIKQQHMDNKLKDFLLSAHSKFKDTTTTDELNILAICCADRMDMQKWFHYMYGLQGLFKEDSFHPCAEYKNVDVVLLSNLHHRHHQYWTKDKIKKSWDFSKSFNLIFSNPLRRDDKAEIIWSLVENIPNHSKELMNYRGAHGLDELRIPHFVIEMLLNKGLYYFQPDI